MQIVRFLGLLHLLKSFNMLLGLSLYFRDGNLNLTPPKVPCFSVCLCLCCEGSLQDVSVRQILPNLIEMALRSALGGLLHRSEVNRNI